MSCLMYSLLLADQQTCIPAHHVVTMRHYNAVFINWGAAEPKCSAHRLSGVPPLVSRNKNSVQDYAGLQQTMPQKYWLRNFVFEIRVSSHLYFYEIRIEHPALADPGGRGSMPPSSHMLWPIRPYSSLKQHVHMINILKKHEIFNRQNRQLCTWLPKSFELQGLCPLTCWPGALPLDSTGARPIIGSRYRTGHASPPPLSSLGSASVSRTVVRSTQGRNENMLSSSDWQTKCFLKKLKIEQILQFYTKLCVH